jgi:DHA1 family quinolone resistance protein-like MFS transporter
MVKIKQILSGLKDFFHLNKILRTLVISDVLILSSYGLMAPIFAVFLTDKIVGGSLIVVGISETIYLAVKSLLQIPIGILIDKTEGEKIDFWLVFTGTLIDAICIALYIVASLPIHIYLIGFLYGIGSAMCFPAWMGLFTRNMEKGKESFVWSLHTTPTELGAAFAALFGAIIAEKMGFDFLFAVVSLSTLFGAFILYTFYKEITG